MKKKRLICIGVVTMLLIMGVITYYFTRNKTNYNPVTTVILTVDEENIYLDEVMYHLTLSRMQGQLYASFMNDTDYMNRDYGDGRTIGDVMKQEAMDNAIRYELLYQKAIQEGYELTLEEINNSKDKTENIIITVPEEDMKNTGLTENKLVSIQEKIALATRYYQTVYEGNNLTDQEIYEQLKEGHRIIIQKKVWSSVKF